MRAEGAYYIPKGSCIIYRIWALDDGSLRNATLCGAVVPTKPSKEVNIKRFTELMDEAATTPKVPGLWWNWHVPVMRIDLSTLNAQDVNWLLSYNRYHLKVNTPNFTPVDVSQLQMRYSHMNVTLKPVHVGAPTVTIGDGGSTDIARKVLDELMGIHSKASTAPKKPFYARADPSFDGCTCRVCRTPYPYTKTNKPNKYLLCEGCKQLARVFS